jgi:DGQHR domain-containing protein
MSVTTKSVLTLPAIQVSQDGHLVYLTSIRAEDLAAYTKVDRFDPSLPIDHPDQGYQRREEMPRVKKLANWLRQALDDGNGVLMPTSLLASTRKGSLNYDPQRGTLTLSGKDKLHLVDGQHRRAGLLYAINEKGRDELRDFQVPLVIVENLSTEDEMRQFAVVNSTQKSVRTDLVNMILTQLAAGEGDEAIKEKEQWRVVVSRTLQALNSDLGGPWYDLILMPNETGFKKSEFEEAPELEHKKLVRATSFMSSLKPIYDYLDQSLWDVRGLSTAQRATELAVIVTAFWAALRQLNAEAFDRPGDYVIQKTPGLFALHRFCKRLLPVMYEARRPWDLENFVAVLEPCSELGDPSFWQRTGGDAAKYGSMKGFAELADLLWESRRA